MQQSIVQIKAMCYLRAGMGIISASFLLISEAPVSSSVDTDTFKKAAQSTTSCDSFDLMSTNVIIQ